MISPVKTENLPADPSGIARAVQVLQDGGRVSFPTETVFGLGADASNGAAVAGIYEAKGRPSFNPLIVHVAELKAAQKIAEFNSVAVALAGALWPGPMSLVLPLKPDHGLSSLVTAGLSTVAIRVPKHPLAKDLLTAFDAPIAAPSANPSGRISATKANHVLAGLNGKIEAILMGDDVTVGLESTILMPLLDQVVILRQGGISQEEITKIIQVPITISTTENDAPKSPGQLTAHYAPNARLRMNVITPDASEIFIGLGPTQADFNLSLDTNLQEAAANLFDMLHQADELAAQQGKTIAVAPVPDHGLGAAINDRLSRAASG